MKATENLSKKIINAQDNTIGEYFFNTTKKFQIPRYQRGYTWSTDQAREFFEDLDKEKNLFIGTIILQKGDDVYEIIDGQQRVVTINILAAVIRNILKEFKHTDFIEMAEAIHEEVIGKKQITSKGVTYKYYLEASDSIKQYFEAYIQNKDNTPLPPPKKKSEEEKVKQVYEIFYDYIQKKIDKSDNKRSKELLYSFFDKMRNIVFVLIEIEDDSLAYDIFESVNAKGVDLSVGDLIKNQIFKNVIESNKLIKDVAQAKWNDILQNLQEANTSIKEFLQYQWASRYGYITEKRLYKSIKSKLNSKEEWKQYLLDLESDSAIYRIIQIGSIGDIESLLPDANKKIQSKIIFKNLEILRNTGAKTWSILILVILANYNKIDVRLTPKWQQFSRFVFVYFQILGLPGNWFFSQICKHSKDLYTIIKDKKRDKKTDFNEAFIRLWKKFEEKKPLIEAFKDSFSKIEYADSSFQRFIIRHILSEIEQKLEGKYGVGFDIAKINIEHILPQEPKKWGLTKKNIEDHVHSIGNLILLSKPLNSELQESKLSDKLVAIKKNGRTLFLVKQLVENIQNKRWDFSTIPSSDFQGILNRANDLAVEAYEIFITQNFKSMLGK